MNIKTLLLAATLALSSIIPAQASTLDQIKNATYELWYDNLPICSGTFVTPTQFLTASHCIHDDAGSPLEHSYSLHIASNVGISSYELAVNKVNVFYDTATLNLVDTQARFPFVDVAKDVELNVGDELVLSAYPMVLDYLWLSKGLYAGTVKTPVGLIGQISYITSLNTAPGSSGGGVYTLVDGTYKLIGTIEGGPQAHDYMTFTSVLAGVHSVLD